MRWGVPFSAAAKVNERRPTRDESRLVRLRLVYGAAAGGRPPATGKKRPGAQNKEALTPRRKNSTGNGPGSLWVRDPVEWEHQFVVSFQLFWEAWASAFNHHLFILKWAVSILEIEWSELDTKLGLLSCLTSISSCYSDCLGLYTEFSLRMKRIPEGGIRVFVLVYYCSMNYPERKFLVDFVIVAYYLPQLQLFFNPEDWQ